MRIRKENMIILDICYLSFGIHLQILGPQNIFSNRQNAFKNTLDLKIS